MNDAYDRTVATTGYDLAGSLRSARERFEAAWDAHESGGPEPRIEAFLRDLPDSLLAPISSVLEGIDRDRRERRGGEPKAFDRPGSTESEADVRLASTFEVRPGTGDGATLDIPQSGLPLGTTLRGPASPSDAETLDAPSSRPTDSPAPHRPIGPVGYELVKELGRGGMGIVYKACQLGLGRDVALKMVLAGAHASPEQLARFRTEARAIAQLRHPGIVQVYEVGEHAGLPYFSLEFVEGGSLAERLRKGPWPPREAVQMVVLLARAMQAAHDRGIIHRDLKPANILLGPDGSPKITDFGLAKRLELDEHQTHTGTVLGTPTYMAPEQAWGHSQEVGPHSDQYSLGVVLYEMLTGRPPFQGSSTIETLEAVRTQEPVSPARLQPKLPKDLETVCLKVLSKEPAKRYESAGAMADDLERFLRDEPILARPVSRPERLWRWCKRNPRVAGLAAAVALMGIAITAGSVAFAGSLKALNAELAESYKKEERAKEDAQEKERAATLAKNDAVAARNAEAEALEKERQAREKAEALVQGAFAQNRNALEAQRVLSVLLNQRLLSIPGTQAVREELIKTTLTGLEATIASLEKLGTVARDKEGFAVATRTLAGINQRAGLIAMEYGKYDETSRYFRRMEDLSEQLAAAEPEALEPLKVKASVKATLGDFQMDRIGDGRKALAFFDQALALRRQWLAREPSNDDAKRGVANILGALARARLRLGDPARARALYREEIELRDQFSPALADQIEVRRESAGLRDKLG
ncbi:MAG TPA: serine/threonine-protein kinase, partial [Isosphaeraceae bacterium]